MAAADTRQESSRTLTSDLWPSERRAVTAYRATLCGADGTPPSLRATIRQWETNVAPCWRRAKLKRDIACQVEQIHRHRVALARQMGEHVTLEEAAQDWIEQQADSWRIQWEQCCDSDVPIEPFLQG
jgi:hypothetical protein